MITTRFYSIVTPSDGRLLNIQKKKGKKVADADVAVQISLAPCIYPKMSG